MAIPYIFTVHLTNNSVCISSTFLLVKTKQDNGEYALYLAPFLIVPNIKLC